MILATVVDWAALGKVVLYSLVSAVGVTAIFSLGIVGLTRFDERHRVGASAIAYAALALLCALAVAAVVIEAIVIMTQK